jgi:hypothetical protein
MNECWKLNSQILGKYSIMMMKTLRLGYVEDAASPPLLQSTDDSTAQHHLENKVEYCTKKPHPSN